MNASEKRKIVVDRVKSREGKNSYTQGNKRDQVASGYSDCSSLQHWAYQGIGMEIGTYTGAQIQKGSWVTQGGAYPNESILQPGDELFFSSGSNNGRPYNVGHIEMYVGGGQISGHGSGIGPTRKNMIAYCQQRNASGKPYIGTRRYIANDGSGNQGGGSTTPISPESKAIVKSGQIHCNNFCNAGLTIDGDRGPNTKIGGIKALQQAMNLDYKAGLSVDGIWGQKSDAALTGHNVWIGETQYMVTALQILLMLRGYDPKGVESPGSFGEGCLTALKSYQKAAGLSADGVAGYNTFKSLIA